MGTLPAIPGTVAGGVRKSSPDKPDSQNRLFSDARASILPMNYSNQDVDIPDPIADDAPSPDDVGDTVRYPGTGLCDVVAVDYDGERYCRECANPEYVELCKEDPYAIPYGGPVDRGAEVDCPGSSCGHCLRRIEDMTVLHYDGVCHPDSCPEIDN